MFRRIWNGLRETEWYAVIAIVLLGGALLLAVLIATSAVTAMLWVLAIVLGMAAIVSAIFSHRT
jgi:hypothetical protein